MTDATTLRKRFQLARGKAGPTDAETRLRELDRQLLEFHQLRDQLLREIQGESLA